MYELTPRPLRLKDIAVGDRPQERLAQLGAPALSDAELLAILLRSGSAGANVLNLSQRLLAESGSLAGLLKWTESDFRRLKGIGRVKATQLLAVMELARRVVAGETDNEALLSSPQATYALLAGTIAGLAVEKFWVLCLNRRNRLIKQVEVSSGTATAALAHPREVYREAVRHGATAIICAHNHPSGDPTPSAADVTVTRQLREAAGAVDIHLIDHIVLGRPSADPRGLGYFSFRQSGML
jgi:DNA repair protein RadC